eukprot:1522858-Amphidinium_carterae.1
MPTLLKCLLIVSPRCWYAHKRLFLTGAVELGTHFDAATVTAQSTLFWGLIVSTLHKTTLAKVDTHALHIARLTAGMRNDGKPVEDFNKDTAHTLRLLWGESCLKWSAKLRQLQGQLLGHCLRRLREHPECS